MLKKIKDNKITIVICFISFIFTCITFYISKNVIQPRIFNNIELIFNNKYYLMHTCFILFIFGFYVFILNFAYNLIFKKKKEYLIWFINFIIYLLLMLIVMVIIWPGYWVWDEFNILESTINLELNTWQSYVTVIYYSICMMIFPSPVSIVIIQIVLLSLITSYINMKVALIYKNKRINILLYLFLLTPAVVINNFYPLRLTMYGYILLLFISIMFFDKIEKNKMTFTKLIKLYLLLSILLIWRSEGIIFAVISPLLILLVYFNNSKRLVKIGVFIIFLFLNLVTSSLYSKVLYKLDENLKKVDLTYSLTIFINPLSNMLNDKLNGRNIQNDIDNINKVLDVELLKKHKSYVEIPAYWEEATLVRENYQNYMSDFKKSYVSIILNNPKSFLKARIKTFASTMLMYNNYSGNMNSVLSSYCKTGYTDKIVLSNFLNKYTITKPINKELKVKIENLLLGDFINTTWLRRVYILIFWNILPVLIIILVCIVLSILRKDFFILCLQSSLILYTLILFLTSPANYFMYYFPIYLVGTLISILYIFMFKKEKSLNFKLLENKIEKEGRK